jgi:hypothetical protein
MRLSRGAALGARRPTAQVDGASPFTYSSAVSCHAMRGCVNSLDLTTRCSASGRIEKVFVL